MHPPASIVTARTCLRLVVPGSPSVPVPTKLSYDPSDPLAVTIEFGESPEEVVVWTFARDLLASGLERASGDGDVRVWPSRTHGEKVLFLALDSPSGSALFTVDEAELKGFLSRAYESVPEGDEIRFLDLDAELSRLFS